MLSPIPGSRQRWRTGVPALEAHAQLRTSRTHLFPLAMWFSISIISISTLLKVCMFRHQDQTMKCVASYRTVGQGVTGGLYKAVVSRENNTTLVLGIAFYGISVVEETRDTTSGLRWIILHSANRIIWAQEQLSYASSTICLYPMLVHAL